MYFSIEGIYLFGVCNSREWAKDGSGEGGSDSELAISENFIWGT